MATLWRVRRFATVLTALFLGAALTSAPASGVLRGRLVATIGPGPVLTLEKAVSGARVTVLPAGTYYILVRDRSIIRNLHLVGPGVNKASSVKRARTVVWTVKLRKGTYTYMSDPQRSTLRKKFKVA